MRLECVRVGMAEHLAPTFLLLFGLLTATVISVLCEQQSLHPLTIKCKANAEGTCTLAPVCLDLDLGCFPFPFLPLARFASGSVFSSFPGHQLYDQDECQLLSCC